MNTENLLKLATYLLSGELKAEFDMISFTDSVLPIEQANFKTECGTVGCAAGHGPYAGIPKHSTETWTEYIGRVFDVHVIPNTPNTLYMEWDWLFGADWREIDNTPQGAAKRILYLIRHGLPYNWQDQMNGCAPLTYLNETL